MPTIRGEDLNAALALLVELFPNCFTFENYLPHRPLKVEVDRDILVRCPALDRHELSVALRRYVGRLVYLRAMTEGVARVDLDGNAVGEVSALEAASAAVRIDAILSARAARLTAAREAKQAAAREAKQIAKRAVKARKKAKQAAVASAPATVETSPAPSPSINVVSRLSKKPVLRLPAFRRAGAAS